MSYLFVGILHPQFKGFPNSGVIIPWARLWLQKTCLLQVVQCQYVFVTIGLHTNKKALLRKNLSPVLMTFYTAKQEQDTTRMSGQRQDICTLPAESLSCRSPTPSASGHCCRQTACTPNAESWSVDPFGRCCLLYMCSPEWRDNNVVESQIDVENISVRSRKHF